LKNSVLGVIETPVITAGVESDDIVSKYWTPTMTPDYSVLFKKWQTDTSNAPHDGTIFMGRLTGTNRAIAVKFDGANFISMDQKPVEICQWISFTDFADIRQCVWKGY
jgi:hypothetical protein